MQVLKIFFRASEKFYNRTKRGLVKIKILWHLDGAPFIKKTLWWKIVFLRQKINIYLHFFQKCILYCTLEKIKNASNHKFNVLFLDSGFDFKQSLIFTMYRQTKYRQGSKADIIKFSRVYKKEKYFKKWFYLRISYFVLTCDLS